MEATATTAGSLQDLAAQALPDTPPLKDLLEDGIYLLFLLRSGTAPHSAAEFNQRVDGFLSQFERHAKNFGKPAEAIQHSMYAFCALLDEIILCSTFKIRDDWERNPLQLRLFGDHLAGEGFFDRLENLRYDPQKNLEILEVFYTCLLLGFQGKYLLEGTEKLGFLTGRLNQEITTLRGTKAEFAPAWKPTFRFQEFVRHELPLWGFYALLAVVAILLFIGFTALLHAHTQVLSAARSQDSTLVSRLAPDLARLA